jgi:hypothetical protein
MVDQMNQLTRRDALTALSGTALASKAFGSPQDGERVPWYATMRRCGQTNFNERDPIELNIAWWVEYWMSLKLDALLLSAGGIMAFYPTKIPFHHRSQFLDSHDLFGDYAKAAKAKGIRVVARLDCNYVYEDAYRGHPEWVERTANGEPVTNAESPWLYKTCMYSSYFTELMPAIIREINSIYDIDGFFTNGWPSTNRPDPCYCEACKGSGLSDPNSPEAVQRHLARVLEVWRLWDRTAKEKKWDSVYVGNLGGGIRAVTNLSKIASVAAWFNADHQGRSGATPIWDCAQQGRVAQSVMKGRTITNVTGAYANTQPLWRHTSKAPLEMKMWLAQTTASGMTPWFHWLGGKPRDLRWREPGKKFFYWIAQNEQHFINEASLANLAVVFSQRINAYYKPPVKAGDVTDYLQGMYQVLLQGRILFDFVHEDDLTPDVLSKYKGVILANTALLSDQQCRQLREYVNRGGSLLATFETGFYDEYGKPRSDCGLADVFGIQKSGDIVGPNGNSSYACIERQDHPILRGFSDTTLLPFAQHYVPLRAISDPVLTVLPPFPAFPPEMVYPRTLHTDQPAVVLRERGGSRLVFLPGDIDSSYWRSQDPDLSRLLLNAIRWMCPQTPITVSGQGMAEVFAWKTKAGFAVHLLNYANPEMLRGWFSEPYPLGPQKVRVTLPAGAKASKVHLLAGGTEVSVATSGNNIEFTVPQVWDYEVAAIV